MNEPNNDPQARTRDLLRDWAQAEGGALQEMSEAEGRSPRTARILTERASRLEHVMRSGPGGRLWAASDTIEEARDWNNGRGHLIVTGPGLNVTSLDALAWLGFTPADIETALTTRIDTDGNLPPEALVHALGDLVDATNTERAGYLTGIHARATSPEALRYAETHAYAEEQARLNALSIPELCAQAGHPNLPSAQQAMAERHGFTSFAEFDAALLNTGLAASTLHQALNGHETAIWTTADLHPDTHAADDVAEVVVGPVRT